MTGEPPNDIRAKWQNQPNEAARIPVEEIRQKAEKLQRKARREVLRFYALALLFVVVFGRSFATAHATLPRIGLSILIAWSISFPYQARKRIWPKSSAADVTSTTCLDFYRRELERRRDYTQQIWRWLLGPAFLGLGVFLLPAVIKVFERPRLWVNLLPIVVLLVIWAVIAIPRRKKELRNLQRELDALDALQS